jgi:hypothetical protein
MNDDKDFPLELGTIVPGEVVFLELPQLPLGLHTVRISARDPSGTPQPLGDLNVIMRIREARPWMPGANPQGPLLVQLDPARPTIEEVWEGRAEIIVRGPSGRQVKTKISLFSTNGDHPILTKQLPPLPLPVNADSWRNHFQRFFSQARDVQEAYDLARYCHLEFNADELGAYSIRCERNFTPLRWSVRRHQERNQVRLFDDSGSSTKPAVSRYSFESPAVEERLDIASEFDVPTKGGLYVARLDEIAAAIIAPPTGNNLADLQCEPRFSEQDRSVTSILRLLALAKLWGSAALPGDLFSMIRQRTVMLELVRQIFRIIAGDRWGYAELAVRDGSPLASLEDAITKRREETPMVRELAYRITDLVGLTCSERVKSLAAIVAKFIQIRKSVILKPIVGIAPVPSKNQSAPRDPEWLCEFTLRLASDPSKLENWAGEQLHAGLTRLLELPTLAKAARYMVIATDNRLLSRATTGELYASWRWF